MHRLFLGSYPHIDWVKIIPVEVILTSGGNDGKKPPQHDVIPCDEEEPEKARNPQDPSSFAFGRASLPKDSAQGFDAKYDTGMKYTPVMSPSRSHRIRMW